MLRAATTGLVLLACAGCASAPPPDPGSQLPALESRIFELINVQRHALDSHAKDLALDSELVDVARKRSVEMAARNMYADASGDRHISATRLMAEDAKFQGLLGENVAAQRYVKSTALDVDRYASSFVATWLASPSHKENLAFADYSLTGVGAALNGDTIYVTQLFAAEIDGKRQSKAASAPIAPGPALRGAARAP